MAASWTAIAAGAAGLAVADAVLSSSSATSRLGSFGLSLSKLVKDFVSVTVPGLPPKANTASTASSSTTSSTKG